MNLLCHGDNLDVLRRHIADESVDLIYLDPPFSSHAGDNAIFAERSVTAAPLEIRTFEDRWGWNERAAGAYEEVMQTGGQVMQATRAFWRFLGDCDLLAYLAMMAPRLVELRRVLKPTGSVYLHCDSAASHYLKLLMDVVFGAAGFRNEIIWERAVAREDADPLSARFGDSTDTILFYAKTGANVFHSQPARNTWDSTTTVGSQSGEHLGYSTEKPEALLERIIRASSDEGAVILDPFCGGGPALAAAERLKRCWIGIDITHLAICLARCRLRRAYGDDIERTYHVIGGPTTAADAGALAASDLRQFQWWALGLVGARPMDSKTDADDVIDGRMDFHEGEGPARHVLLSVNARKLRVSDVSDMRKLVDREPAAVGVLLALSEPAKAVRTRAAEAGFYESSWGRCPRLQIVTVGDLLGGKRLDIK